MKAKALLFGLFQLFIITCLGQPIEIYVSDAGGFSNPPWQILKFDENGANPEVFIDENLAWPQDILFLEDSNLVLISNLNSGRITKYNATTGAYLGNFATGIGGPTRMKIGADSLLYVLQWSGNGQVRRYKLDGTFVDEFTSAGVSQSIGMDWDSEGNLYVSSYGSDIVRKFNASGVDQGNFISSNLQGPTNIWFDDNGDLLVADYDGSAVKRFSSDGVFINNFISGLNNVEGVAFFANGDILLGNGGSSSVKMYDSAGVYIKEFVSSGSGGLMTPNAIVIREPMALSIPDFVQQRNVVVPSTGGEFEIHPNFRVKVPTLSIYSMTGAKIEVVDIRESHTWKPAAYPDGMYIVVAEIVGGRPGVQKIILDRN